MANIIQEIKNVENFFKREYQEIDDDEENGSNSENWGALEFENLYQSASTS